MQIVSQCDVYKSAREGQRSSQSSARWGQKSPGDTRAVCCAKGACGSGGGARMYLSPEEGLRSAHDETHLRVRRVHMDSQACYCGCGMHLVAMEGSTESGRAIVLAHVASSSVTTGGESHNEKPVRKCDDNQKRRAGYPPL